MAFLQIFPDGFVLPPLPHLLALVVGVGIVALGVTRRDLAIDGRHVVALVPWILTGSAVHALYGVEALPEAIKPLGGAPAVYATVGIVAGLVWLAAEASVNEATTPRVLGLSGVVAVLVTGGAAVAVGVTRGTFAPFWPTVALVVGVAVGAAVWLFLTRLAPRVEATGAVGVVAVVGHALDGVSTAVGVDVLGFGERTPLSRLILETASSLPTADVIGSGWLFVLVKLAVVSVVVVLFADLVREEPREGFLLLGFVAAVGLGPGSHNLLLFAIA